MEKASNPKVSIIVPVYNVEEYLPKCLDSLINQTLKDIEIICINDGSTDKSLQILKEYAKNDLRFVIIDQKNAGQGVARNIGIEHANGEYIGFVDPDDWVDIKMYEEMYTQAKTLQSEIVICNYKKVFITTGETNTPLFFAKALSMRKQEKVKIEPNVNIDKETLHKTLLISPCFSWNRIYQRKLLIENNIRFDTIRCFEDCIFILASHITANNISFSDKAYYNYQIRPTSTLRAYDERYKDLLITIDKLHAYLLSKDKYSEFSINLKHFIFTNSYGTYQNTTNRKNKQALLTKLSYYLPAKEYLILNNKLLLQNIFSLTNNTTKTHKIITCLGVKIKIRRRNK